MSLLQQLPDLISGEIVAVSFNYTTALNTGVSINSALVVPELWSGTDPNLNLTIVGSPTINGAYVTQLIKSGVPNCVYRYLCYATLSDSQVLVIPTQLVTVTY